MGKIKTNQEIAYEVIDGKWGNGVERRERLQAAGYNYNDVQSIVNSLVYSGSYTPLEDPVTDQGPDQTVNEPQGNYLDIKVDLSQYDGIRLIFGGE